MTTVNFQSHVTMFRDLSQIEDISDLDYDKLTLAEDCILAHTPSTPEDLAPMQAVIRARYGEPQDAQLHNAIAAIVNFAVRGTRRLAA